MVSEARKEPVTKHTATRSQERLRRVGTANTDKSLASTIACRERAHQEEQMQYPSRSLPLERMEVYHTEEAQPARISSSSGSSKASKASPQQGAEAHLAPLESHQQVCQFHSTSNRQANTKTRLSSPVPSISNRALRL